jgi:hypothetical protein
MLKFLSHAAWAASAGALIPVMAVLNARLGRVLGEPSLAAFECCPVRRFRAFRSSYQRIRLLQDSA